MGEFDAEEQLGVKKLSDLTYVGNYPLTKPAKESRGVYGGNLAGQAVLVAIRASPEGFRPHSLHSYFVKMANSKTVIDWEVEVISNGKNFCNRIIKGSQDGEIKYFANVSLTKKNSYKQSLEEYEEFERKKASSEDDDDDDDDYQEIQKPFEFQTPYHDWFKRRKIEEIEFDNRGSNIEVAHKIIPELLDLESTKEEDSLPVTERKLSYYVKWGTSEKLKFEDPSFQYVGLCILSDSLFLTRLARSLRIPGLALNDMVHYFSVSLDHVIYFHDDDFDATKWMGFSFKPIRLVNNRTVLEAEMYNENGFHVATVIQEGLVFFNGLEENAKL